MTDFSTLGLSDLRALEKQIRAQKKDIQAQEHARLAVHLTDYVETVVTEQSAEESDASAWVGYKAYAIPMTLDGVQFSVSVTITDVAARDKREPIFDKAKKDADAQKLTGDARKKFIADALAGANA